MSKQKQKELWIVREWDSYGRWNQSLRKTYYFEAESRKDALAQYNATCQPDPRLQKPTVKASTY